VEPATPPDPEHAPRVPSCTSRRLLRRRRRSTMTERDGAVGLAGISDAQDKTVPTSDARRGPDANESGVADTRLRPIRDISGV